MFDKQLINIPGIRKALLVCAGASAADALMIAVQCIALASAIVGIWQGGALHDQLIYIAVFFASFVLRKVAQNAQLAFIDRFAAATRESLEDGLLEAVYRMGPVETGRYGTAAVVGNLIEGTAQIEEYLRIIVPRTMGVVVVPFLLLVLMFAFDWVSGIIALIMYPFIIIFMRLIGMSAKAEATKRHKQFERMSNNFLDTAAGVDTLSAFDAGSAFSESIFRASEKFRRLTMKTLRIAMLSSTVLDVFATLALAAVAIMLGFRLVEGTLAFLPALIMLMAVPDYFKPIKDFGSNYHATLDGKTALDAITGIIGHAGTIEAVREMPAREDTESTGSAVNRPPLELSLADVCYRYSPVEGESPAADGSAGSGSSADNNGDSTVSAGISNVNLHLQAPCKAGIFGVSGAGKSTLLDILAGFISPDSGTIAINGTATDTLKLAPWLRRVAYIPQNPYIFHATLRDNLAFYNPHAGDADIAHALDAVGLREVVARLPQGLDTPLGKGGRTLSGGQAQRVAVARALLDPARDVWILDEPTAHLDIETEYELKTRLLPLMRDKLVVLATHRTHWERDMDVCFSVEAGTVVAMAGGDAA